MERGAWWASPWGLRESDASEREHKPWGQGLLLGREKSSRQNSEHQTNREHSMVAQQAMGSGEKGVTGHPEGRSAPRGHVGRGRSCVPTEGPRPALEAKRHLRANTPAGAFSSRGPLGSEFKLHLQPASARRTEGNN